MLHIEEFKPRQTTCSQFDRKKFMLTTSRNECLPRAYKESCIEHQYVDQLETTVCDRSI